MPYVWDEPTKAPRLTVIAPGGLSSIYDMAILKEGNQSINSIPLDASLHCQVIYI